MLHPSLALVVIAPIVGADITKPPFSWDTVGGMVFIQLGDPKGTMERPLDEKTRNIVAKYPMVTFEKFQGRDTAGYYEDKAAAACKSIKAINPKLSCIMYLNTECGYTGYRMIDELYKLPQYWLRKSDGKAAYNHCHKIGCRNAKCPPEGLLIPDYSIPEASKFYFSACSNMTRDGPVDGCNMDRSNDLVGKRVPSGGAPAKGGAAFDKGKLQGEINIAGDAYLWINNIGTDTSVTGAFGNCIEGFGPNEKSITTLQKLAKENLGAKAHCCRGPSGSATGCEWNAVQDGLAAFLVGAGENAFFACGVGFTMGSWVKWFDQYDYPLGPPIAEGVKGKDGTWTRSFKSGTTVSFNPKTNKGKINWARHPTQTLPNSSIVVTPSETNLVV